jgi:hypothetical protein
MDPQRQLEELSWRDPHIESIHSAYSKGWLSRLVQSPKIPLSTAAWNSSSENDLGGDSQTTANRLQTATVVSRSTRRNLVAMTTERRYELVHTKRTLSPCSHEWQDAVRLDYSSRERGVDASLLDHGVELIVFHVFR